MNSMSRYAAEISFPYDFVSYPLYPGNVKIMWKIVEISSLFERYVHYDWKKVLLQLR